MKNRFTMSRTDEMGVQWFVFEVNKEIPDKGPRAAWYTKDAPQRHRCWESRESVRHVAELKLGVKWPSRNSSGGSYMQIQIESRYLEDVVVIVPDIFQDGRGFFSETFRADQFEALGLPTRFVQENHSRSTKAVVRGLHFQWDPSMGKLMRVTAGAAFLVAVDIRRGSPNLGKWVGIEASPENRRCVWAPAGFARGFCALSDNTEIQYKCTGIYNSKAESAIRWNDPMIGIKWPLADVIVSEKDRTARTLAEWLASPESDNFRYSEQPEPKFSLRS